MVNWEEFLWFLRATLKDCHEEEEIGGVFQGELLLVDYGMSLD